MTRRWLQSLYSLLIVLASFWVQAAPQESPNIRRDGQWVKEDHYLAPNEFYGHLYAPVLVDKKGTLIAVGTFRALERAVDASLAGGGFSRVVMMDYDLAAQEFNQLHLNLLMELKQTKADRYQYLMTLFGNEEQLDLLDRVRKGKISDKTYLNKLLDADTQGNCALCSPASRQLRKFLNDRRGEELRNGLHLQATAILQHPKYMKHSIFGSDDYYRETLRVVAKTPILILAGNIAGSKTFADLSAYLKKQGEKVSVVDVSNAPEYFHNFNFPKLGKLFKPFAENLKRLPLANKALLLFTLQPTPELGSAGFDKALQKKVSAKDGWIYVAANMTDILPRLGNEIYDQDGFYRYVESIAKNKDCGQFLR